jgi:hypothetical protein
MDSMCSAENRSGTTASTTADTCETVASAISSSTICSNVRQPVGGWVPPDRCRCAAHRRALAGPDLKLDQAESARDVDRSSSLPPSSLRIALARELRRWSTSALPFQRQDPCGRGRAYPCRGLKRLGGATSDAEDT